MNKLIINNCNIELPNIKNNSVDLVYMDPPFFTQRTHALKNRENIEYKFDDKYSSLEDYLSQIGTTIEHAQRILKDTGSIFVHCDKTASHHLRQVLDERFGTSNFRSEIIWSYKRWSNSKKGLLNSHQVIFFYSKTDKYKFNTIYTEYSPSTNLDQILQKRIRNKNGKTTYAKSADGEIINNLKNGVPLSDVWNIPLLNPKAKERVGYPTQKPISLLRRIIEISTNEGDLVLDPYCGSGTTCVAAKLLNRKYIGIDISEDAIALAQGRIDNPIESISEVHRQGIDSYREQDQDIIYFLKSIKALPVQRNKGIDGFLNMNDEMIPVKVQRDYESISDCINLITKASNDKNLIKKIIFQTRQVEHSLFINEIHDNNIIILKHPILKVKSIL